MERQEDRIVMNQRERDVVKTMESVLEGKVRGRMFPGKHFNF